MDLSEPRPPANPDPELNRTLLDPTPAADLREDLPHGSPRARRCARKHNYKAEQDPTDVDRHTPWMRKKRAYGATACQSVTLRSARPQCNRVVWGGSGNCPDAGVVSRGAAVLASVSEAPEWAGKAGRWWTHQ